MNPALVRKQFFDYLRKLRANTSETFKAEIIQERADGNYDCRHSRTGGTFIASPSVTADKYAAGQLVTIARPDASLRSSGGEHSIVGVQTTNVRNSSTVRFTDSQTTSAETLARIVAGGVDVDVVTLVRGGAAVSIDVYGTELATPAVYGDAGITDNVAQVFTPPAPPSSQLTIDVKASIAVVPGRYSLTVAGVTIDDFFEVV